MIKYLTEHYSNPRIIEVEVEKETESSVWVRGSRSAKLTDNRGYFDSWEDAHAFLLKNAEAKVEQARISLAYYNGKLGNVKGMKKP